GMAAVGEEEANVVLVVDEKDLKGRDIHEFYLGAVLKNRRRREILSGAHAVERVRTVDSLAYSVKRVPCGGLVLVGDAMGFIDPFTGEGIYLSLRSAQLAAESIGEGFKAGGFSRNYLQSYETRRHREFHKKFALSRVLQRLIYNPSLCNFVVGALGKNPSLASTLVGVLGDYIPAEKVVSLKFLIKLFAGILNPENNSSSALVSLRSTFRE
ncbi:MAG: geranylgeranyl reductase, partial [Nitrospinae bacterium]|nr:geranylgeranyl reductase [Nitrospinota bacterium]